ncbi:hypothetical protein FSP39_019240 [Pinctada imbricata]|uniref:UFSP1/2/DUB catalytic domain-containing protein n=1 Tax=Pinctada imbricata TaxID=66713 RepID=A0AA89BW54_PINIB|nr:hypothetical protein FSP39_019240 [Pinctada imbricata]
MSAQCYTGSKLLQDVHKDLTIPGQDTELVKGSYDYYHYGCDGLDDRGWGCGYRTLQTMSSWIWYQKNQSEEKSLRNVPSIPEVQEALVKMEDKSTHFKGSREWIGSFEISICLDYFYEVPCRLVHVPSGRQLVDHIDTLYNHFHVLGSPVMMGGDSDNASKGIVGVCKNPPSLLVVVRKNGESQRERERERSKPFQKEV